MKKNFQSITFDHDVVYYIPCYQVDATKNTYTTFTYAMSDATSDEQMAWSMQPDYVLKLEGHFHATTKNKKRKRK